jgi:hypothetical protein
MSIVSNSYAFGTDTLGNGSRNRWHSDDSIEVKYFDQPGATLGKAAFSLTLDLGCESGGGVACGKQYFAGFMLYNRLWFFRDLIGLTIGGGAITNLGRYLVLVPPINGATAASGVAPAYFTLNPGDDFKAWDFSVTLDWMPSQFITFRVEFDRRGANVPYFAGSGGMTPPAGNTAPGTLVDNWAPDLARTETRINMAILVKM